MAARSVGPPSPTSKPVEHSVGLGGPTLRIGETGVGWRFFISVGLVLALVVGCARDGGGRVELTALNYRSIDPPTARFVPIELDRCFWWTDDQGQIWIAMEREQPIHFAGLSFVFQLSLVLEKPPAGRARNYLVSERELRAVTLLGPAEGRYVSQAGIVALYREDGDHLRGSFRLRVVREVARLLGGWSHPTQHLMLGRFDAVHDPQRGRAIVEGTDVSGWEREAPTSQPAGT